MDSAKILTLGMIFFIGLSVGFYAGLLVPNEIAHLFAGMTFVIILAGLLWRTVSEHFKAHDDRVEMIEMERYSRMLRGEQKKQEKAERESNTGDKSEENENMDIVSKRKKELMLQRIEARRKEELNLEINNK